MTSVGASDAKRHLPRLLEQVESGETITITKHGREIARLVPVTQTSANPDEIIAALHHARSGVRWGPTLAAKNDRRGSALMPIVIDPSVTMGRGARIRAPLATLDSTLIAAAKTAGVELAIDP